MKNGPSGPLDRSGGHRVWTPAHLCWKGYRPDAPNPQPPVARWCPGEQDAYLERSLLATPATAPDVPRTPPSHGSPITPQYTPAAIRPSDTRMLPTTLSVSFDRIQPLSRRRIPCSCSANFIILSARPGSASLYCAIIAGGGNGPEYDIVCEIISKTSGGVPAGSFERICPISGSGAWAGTTGATDGRDGAALLLLLGANSLLRSRLIVRPYACAILHHPCPTAWNHPQLDVFRR